MKQLFYLLTLGVLFSACKHDADYAPYSGVIHYSISDTSKFLADDSSKVNVQIHTTGASDSDYFVVSFPAAGGLLQYPDASNKVFIHNNTASFQIQSGVTPGDYLLTIQFKSKSLSYTQFTIPEKPALPDLLLVDASRSKLDTSNTATIFSVTLKRKQGVVSIGRNINARAYQLNKNQDTVAVGRFTGLLPNKTDSTGKVTLSYFSDTGGFNKAQPVYFKFSCLDNNGNVIQSIYSMTF